MLSKHSHYLCLSDLTSCISCHEDHFLLHNKSCIFKTKVPSRLQSDSTHTHTHTYTHTHRLTHTHTHTHTTRAQPHTHTPLHTHTHTHTPRTHTHTHTTLHTHTHTTWKKRPGHKSSLSLLCDTPVGQRSSFPGGVFTCQWFTSDLSQCLPLHLGQRNKAN